MMDLKEIIKWFIPCFHILLINKRGRTNVYMTFVCLFLISNTRPGYGAKVNSISDTKISFNNLNNNHNNLIVNRNSSTVNQSEYISNKNVEQRAIATDNSIGRTFGRPFKKMAAALIPLVFQMGAAATWAVVAALVGIKTLGVTLVILKLLLIAGAVKIGALFGHKGHHSSGWEPPPHSPQKEIHLHIHNGQHGHSGPDEHIPFSSWSRDGTQSSSDTKQVNVVYEPYVAGPQTISTPYGNYVKI
ncbi:PREDICTED: uncharacterized protein LOC106107360 [Papilio polytes]|uniref:uncharacterized protein LOC106107360 n=1 Tax=Papilio polytes TaxID=76194 RepID=UPI000676998F|nr:PREDICTED: uncharacterized protein LOC106107360 [Papilio polytes]